MSRKFGKTRGFVLVLVLLFTVALVGVGIGVFKSLQSYRRLNVQDIVGTKLVLKSALDYLTNGIQKQWCFDESFVPSIKCRANDNGNTIRLSLPEQTLRGRLKTTDSIASISPNPRRAMVTKLRFDQVTSEHPLKFALSQMADKNLNNMALCSVVKRLDKDDNYVKYLPGATGEALAFLLVRVALTAESVECTADLEAHPAMQSVLVVYPRELNEFALVVAGSLDLSKASSSASGAGGDLSIPAYSDLESRNSTLVKGIQFLSPVYVNHSLVYWGGSQDSTAHSFPHVDFFAPVYIGDQVRLSNGTDRSKFEAAIAAPAKWSELAFSGLRKGVRLEAQNDLGLDVLSGSYTPPSPDTPVDHTAFQQCLDEAKITVDRNVTEGSKLIIKQIAAPITESVGGSSTTTFQFRVGLTKKDKFVSMATVADKISTALIHCNPGADSCRELSIDESKVSLTKTTGYENAAPILKISLDPSLQTGVAHLEANLTTAEDLTIPIDVNSRRDGLSTFESGSSQIQIHTEPYLISGHAQPDQISLSIKFKDLKGNLDQAAFSISPYTLGNDSSTGEWQRDGQIPPAGLFNFVPSDSADFISSNFGSAATSWKTSSSADVFDINKVAETSLGLPDDSVNRGAIIENCQAEHNWESTKGSFLGQARFSWDFALPTGYDRRSGDPSSVTFDASSNTGSFGVGSIMNTCTVTSAATLVAGFYVCDKLVIDSRNQPLDFVGTFIVTSSSKIDRSAVDAGITFSSIHEPTAIQKLRAANILPAATQETGVPWWHPALTIDKVSEIQNALPGSLRMKAIPFTWTALDPDCGLVPGGVSTTCDKEIKNLVVSELGSRFDL